MLKIISLNIEFNKHLDLIVPFFKKENADVLLLQEVLEEDLEYLKKELNMNFVFTPLTQIKFPFGNKMLGLAAFTNERITNQEVTYYAGKSDRTSIISFDEPDKMNRAVCTVWIEDNGQTYCFSNTHFTWTEGGLSTKRQLDDLDKMKKILDEVGEFVLCGDFNAPRGRTTFDKLAELYKDNIPQDVTTTLDKNLHYAGDLQLVVDGLFTTKSYQARNVRLVNGVSDHLVVVANIEKN